MILTAHVIELVHNIAAITFFTVRDSRWKSYGTVSLVENHVIEMLAPSPLASINTSILLLMQ